MKMRGALTLLPPIEAAPEESSAQQLGQQTYKAGSAALARICKCGACDCPPPPTHYSLLLTTRY